MAEQIPKVVKVIDQFRVVINRGQVDGIKAGDRYLICQIGEELFDPETEESLGHVEIVKGRGKVTHVQERLATLETYETEHFVRRTSGPYRMLFGATEYEGEERKSFDNPAVGDAAKKIDGTLT